MAHIYSVLSDPSKRKFYDQFGEASETLAGLDEASAIYEAVMEYINSMKRVTKNDISDFFKFMEQHRKNKTVSPDEDVDLQGLFKKFDGDTAKYVHIIPVACNSHLAVS